MANWCHEDSRRWRRKVCCGFVLQSGYVAINIVRLQRCGRGLSTAGGLIVDSTVTVSFTLKRSRLAMMYMCLQAEWV